MEPDALLGSHRGVSRTTSAVPARPPARHEGRSSAHFYAARSDGAGRPAWLLPGSRATAEHVVQNAMTAVSRGFDRLEVPAASLRRAAVNAEKPRHRDERRRAERLTL